MSENSLSKEPWYRKATRRILPILFSMPMVLGADRGESPKQIESDPTPDGIPTESAPVRVPRNVDSMIEIFIPPMLPTNWQEDPKYENDRRTITWQNGMSVEISDALLADQHIVLDAVGMDPDGNPLYGYHSDRQPSTPRQELPNAVRQVLSAEDPTATPPAEIVETPEPELPQHAGYLPVMDMEIQTRNGEQIVRFFMQHPEANPGAGSYIVEVNSGNIRYSDGRPVGYDDFKYRHPSIRLDQPIPSLDAAQQAMRPIVSVDEVVIYNGEPSSEPVAVETPTS